jgi:hypothetical protein
MLEADGTAIKQVLPGMFAGSNVFTLAAGIGALVPSQPILAPSSHQEVVSFAAL